MITLLFASTVSDKISSALGAHGVEILLTIVAAILLRHFGMMVIRRIVRHSIDSSEHLESKRDRKLRSDTIIGIIDSVFKFVIWIMIVVTIGIELGLAKYLQLLLGSAVAISLLVGFGIQTFIKDLVSGFFIVAENQYRVGDVVSLTTTVGGDVEGLVTRITLRTTILRDNDGAIHVVPNGNIARCANRTLDYAKVNIELSLPLDCDFSALETAVNKLGIGMQKDEKWRKKLVQAPYYHGVQSLTSEEAVVEIRTKTIPAAQWKVSSELRKQLAELLHANTFFAGKKKSSKKITS